jgi:hypothetical protein
MIVDYLRTSYAFVIPPILGFFILIFLCLISFLRGARVGHMHMWNEHMNLRANNRLQPAMFFWPSISG